VEGAVDRNLAEIEADHAVISPQRLLDERVEDPGGEPFVASPSQRRLSTFAKAACDVPAATGDEAEQARLEAVPIRDAPAVAAERMRLVVEFRQVAGNGRPLPRCRDVARAWGLHQSLGFGRRHPRAALDLCHHVLNDLVGTDKTEVRPLFDQLLNLPELDSSLPVRAPDILTPDIDRAIIALRTGDDEDFDRALEQVLPTLDTLNNRVALARRRHCGKVNCVATQIPRIRTGRTSSGLPRSGAKR
jgi:hypothetical protein